MIIGWIRESKSLIVIRNTLQMAHAIFPVADPVHLCDFLVLRLHGQINDVVVVVHCVVVDLAINVAAITRRVVQIALLSVIAIALLAAITCRVVQIVLLSVVAIALLAAITVYVFPIFRKEVGLLTGPA